MVLNFGAMTAILAQMGPGALDRLVLALIVPPLVCVGSLVILVASFLSPRRNLPLVLLSWLCVLCAVGVMVWFLFAAVQWDSVLWFFIIAGIAGIISLVRLWTIRERA